MTSRLESEGSYFLKIIGPGKWPAEIILLVK